MRQEARCRVTLQAGLCPLSITPTTTVNSTITTSYSNREPYGSDLTEPTPPTDVKEPEPSDTDSSTGSPIVTLPYYTKLEHSIRMDNTDKQTLAEVQIVKMKDCPILTTRKITPLILQSWSLACKRYMKHAEKEPEEIVSYVAEAMLEPHLIAWYQAG